MAATPPTLGRKSRSEDYTAAKPAPKKPYRTEIELVERKALQSVTIRTKDPLPGHVYIPEGQGQRRLIDLCIEEARERGKTMMAVVDKPSAHTGSVSEHVNRLGYQFPSDVVDAARAKLTMRHRQHGNNEEPQTDEERRKKIKEYFPRIPPKDLEAIVRHAWQPGKIGTAKNMDIGRRVQLAVCARIRHDYTNYDAMLTWLRNQNAAYDWRFVRNHARLSIAGEVIEVIKKWRGEDKGLTEEWREVVVIDDDDDDDDDDEIIGLVHQHAARDRLPDPGVVVYDAQGNAFPIPGEGYTPPLARHRTPLAPHPDQGNPQPFVHPGSLRTSGGSETIYDQHGRAFNRASLFSGKSSSVPEENQPVAGLQTDGYAQHTGAQQSQFAPPVSPDVAMPSIEGRPPIKVFDLTGEDSDDETLDISARYPTARPLLRPNGSNKTTRVFAADGTTIDLSRTQSGRISKPRPQRPTQHWFDRGPPQYQPRGTAGDVGIQPLWPFQR